MIRLSALFLLFILTACGLKTPEKGADLRLTAVNFQDLPGWQGDDLSGFAAAFGRSCQNIAKLPDTRAFKPAPQAGTAGDWKRICQKFQKTPSAQYKRFFQTAFIPYQVSAGQNAEGLFTGYYEASLKGSRTKTPRYNIPLHARPDDLIMVQLGDFRDDLKGRRIAGRVVGGRLKPYENREEIIAGDWPHNDKTLVWVDNAVDAFFVQIQGSGVVELEGGQTMRIGYAGQNGHPYHAIGRTLINRGALTKETVSMQSIRSWLAQNPDQADEIMNTNKSYVFFREIKSGGPIGGQGVVLTPLRSLAIDHTLLSYGLPVWLETDQPQLKRLMVAQDTGGAIRGAVRGDVFWGYGDKAETMAGAMKAQGRYWLLLPKR